MSDSAHDTWSYREIECRLHHIDAPTETRWFGYTKFGDTWVEAIDRTGTSEEAAREAVENFIDRQIKRIETGSDPLNTNPIIDPIDYDPIPDIEPHPPDIEPFPPEPEDPFDDDDPYGGYRHLSDSAEDDADSTTPN